jgi:hypothetical protein
MDAAAVVQRQLDAYNAHDLDGLMATYAEDAQQFEHPSTLLASGSAQIRERFATRFREAKPHATLLRRIATDKVVIDHELVSSTFPEGRVKMELVAIYQLQAGRIAKAWFIYGTKVLDTAAP